MAIKKTDRIAVYQKYNGRCAYCGKIMCVREMQVDHIISKRRGGKDEMNNYNPSCKSCNHYKRSCSVDAFRGMLKTLTARLMKIYIVRVALDYGIISINEWDERFYFEREVKN